MSSFEIFLIVGVCIVPFVAFMFVMPKFKKKEKTKVQTKTYEELKKEEKVEEKPIVEEPKETKPTFETQDFTSDDFKKYLKYRNENMSHPKKIEHGKDFMDMTTDYLPQRRRLRQNQKPKNIAEEIRNLSPELKALIISGALDKKNFD